MCCNENILSIWISKCSCEVVFRGVFYICCNIQARDWMELHAHVCIGMGALLPLRRWNFVSQPGDFALLQRTPLAENSTSCENCTACESSGAPVEVMKQS